MAHYKCIQNGTASRRMECRGNRWDARWWRRPLRLFDGPWRGAIWDVEQINVLWTFPWLSFRLKQEPTARKSSGSMQWIGRPVHNRKGRFMDYTRPILRAVALTIGRACPHDESAFIDFHSTTPDVFSRTGLMLTVYGICELTCAHLLMRSSRREIEPANDKIPMDCWPPDLLSSYLNQNLIIVWTIVLNCKSKGVTKRHSFNPGFQSVIHRALI